MYMLHISGDITIPWFTGVSFTTETCEFVIASTYTKPDASKDWAARKLLKGASKGRNMTIVPTP